MGRRKHPIFTPLDFFDCYPGALFLPVETPSPLIGWRNADFREQADGCGDGLFRFMYYELCDAEDLDTASLRASRAMHDLKCVHRRLAALLEETNL